MNISTVSYINLDYRQDRFNNMSTQLQHCPYAYYRISGVIVDDPLAYPILPRFQKDLKSRKGVLGVFLSHKKAIEKLINLHQNPEDYSIILEDDIYIHPTFWDLIANLEHDFNEADVILFDASNKLCPYGTFNRVRECYPIIYKLDKNQNAVCYTYPNVTRLCFWGSHCTVIQNKKLQSMLDLLNNIDIYMNIDIFYLTHTTCFIVETNLTHQQCYTFTTDNPRPKS